MLLRVTLFDPRVMMLISTNLFHRTNLFCLGKVNGTEMISVYIVLIIIHCLSLLSL